MDNILDYVFKVNINEVSPNLNTSALKKVCVVTEPKTGVDNTFIEITDKTDISDYTDNDKIGELFDGGLSSIYLCVCDTDDIDDELSGLLSPNINKFFTILIEQAQTTKYNDIVNIARLAGFNGVFGKSFVYNAGSTSAAKTFAADKNCCAFCESSGRNMYFVFGKFLSQTGWLNKQYIQCPANDNIKLTGEMTSLFDDRISFVGTSENYGNELLFFVCGGRAIVAPYILENLKLDLQSAGHRFIQINNPQFNIINAKLLEGVCQKVLQENYIDKNFINDGQVIVGLSNENFIAEGAIRISEPSALWRVKVELYAE